jgi:hypothetical protein
MPQPTIGADCVDVSQSLAGFGFRLDSLAQGFEDFDRASVVEVSGKFAKTQFSSF